MSVEDSSTASSSSVSAETQARDATLKQERQSLLDRLHSLPLTSKEQRRRAKEEARREGINDRRARFATGFAAVLGVGVLLLVAGVLTYCIAWLDATWHDCPTNALTPAPVSCAMDHTMNGIGSTVAFAGLCLIGCVGLVVMSM
jgi:hypothetical protein